MATQSFPLRVHFLLGATRRLATKRSFQFFPPYDALGRRVEKNIGDVERYIRSTVVAPGDRDNISHVIAVYDGSNVWLQNFVWNDETDGIQMLEQADVLDYDTDGNTTELTRSFYHRNALGSVMEITDLNEAAVVSYRYDPNGKVTITRGGTPQTTDPLGQHWTFTARFYDEESDLMYYRARYYDPELGRFLQRDPLGYIIGPCLYEYVYSNAVNLIDPSGLDPAPAKKQITSGSYEVFNEKTEHIGTLVCETVKTTKTKVKGEFTWKWEDKEGKKHTATGDWSSKPGMTNLNCTIKEIDGKKVNGKGFGLYGNPVPKGQTDEDERAEKDDEGNITPPSPRTDDKGTEDESDDEEVAVAAPISGDRLSPANDKIGNLFRSPK